MKISYRNPETIAFEDRYIMDIAVALYRSNRYVFHKGKIDPFLYLRKLREYGIYARAVPVKIGSITVGFKFYNRNGC